MLIPRRSSRIANTSPLDIRFVPSTLMVWIVSAFAWTMKFATRESPYTATTPATRTIPMVLPEGSHRRFFAG